MVCTGDGENARKKERSNMAARSKPSRSKGKPSTKKTKEPTTKREAAELLTSALSYCEEAELIVEGYNEGADLVLVIRSAQYIDGKVIAIEKVTSS
jgi:hypothetical protein